MGKVGGERSSRRKRALLVGTRNSHPHPNPQQIPPFPAGPPPLRRKTRVRGSIPPSPERTRCAPGAPPYLSHGDPAPPACPRAPRARLAASGPARPGQLSSPRASSRPPLPGGISFNFGICSIPNVKDPKTSVPWGVPRPRGRRGRAQEGTREADPRAGAGPRGGAGRCPRGWASAGTPRGARPAPSSSFRTRARRPPTPPSAASSRGPAGEALLQPGPPSLRARRPARRLPRGEIPGGRRGAAPTPAGLPDPAARPPAWPRRPPHSCGPGWASSRAPGGPGGRERGARSGGRLPPRTRSRRPARHSFTHRFSEYLLSTY